MEFQRLPTAATMLVHRLEKALLTLVQRLEKAPETWVHKPLTASLIHVDTTLTALTAAVLIHDHNDSKKFWTPSRGQGQPDMNILLLSSKQ